VSLDSQHRDLRAAGCRKVFSEQASAVGQRLQLRAALDYWREGDALRLYRDGKRVAHIAKELGIGRGSDRDVGRAVERLKPIVAEAAGRTRHSARADGSFHPARTFEKSPLKAAGAPRGQQTGVSGYEHGRGASGPFGLGRGLLLPRSRGFFLALASHVRCVCALIGLDVF